jgi:capsular polysaccharide biosynthesis protein
MENEKTSNREISFLEFWTLIYNNLKFIIVSVIIFGSILTIYAWFIQVPDYKSNADVMVQVAQDSGSSETNFDLVNAFRLIDTVAELMEKEVVLENAKLRLENLGYSDISVRYLREGLSISSSSTSYFITIIFIDENVDLAKDAVDEVINAVIEETDIADAFPVLTNKIRRTSYATDASYNSPNKLFSSFVGVGLGLLFSISFVLVKETFSSNFKNKDEIETALDLPVIGLIPIMNDKENKRNGKK